MTNEQAENENLVYLRVFVQGLNSTKNEYFAYENLMLPGVKSIGKILNISKFIYPEKGYFDHLKCHFNTMDLKVSEFEKLSFYVISMHYIPTLVIKYS